MDKLTVQEAANRLGITEGAVRKRLDRGTLRHEKGVDGRVYVFLDAGQASGQNEMVGELRDRLRYVEDQLAAEREAHAEARRLLLSALEKIPPAIEAPGAPETVAEETVEPTPSEPSEGPQTPTESPQVRRGFFSRLFGGQ